MPFAFRASKSLSLLMLALSTAAATAHAQVTYGSQTITATLNTITNSQTNPSVVSIGESSATGQSTTTRIKTPTSLNVSFNQSTTAYDSTSGSFSVQFTAVDGTTYSILDSAPVFVGDRSLTDFSWNFALQDLSAVSNQDLFSDDDGLITGSLTGTLKAGDVYGFTAGISMSPLSDPTLTYKPTVNFAAAVTPAATPEPSSLVLLCTGLTGLAAGFRRRFQA